MDRKILSFKGGAQYGIPQFVCAQPERRQQPLTWDSPPYWIVHNAPKFGACCAIDVAKDGLGIAVTKGKRYWIVASLNTSKPASRMEWDISTKHIEEFFAFNNGNGWTGFTAFASAFAVYGKTTD